MPSVWADNEEVVFGEGVPSDPAQVYNLLMEALSEQSRVVVSFLVDGVDSLRQGDFPPSFDKIEVFSKTHDELTLQLILETMKVLVDMEEQLKAYACNVLRTPWSEVFQRMEELIDKVKPFAELLDNLMPYVNTYDPPWKEKFLGLASEQTESLGKVLSAFEKGSPSLLSEELGMNFLSVFKRGSKVFSEDIIPYLKESVIKNKSS